jgi:hypothetical protein
MQVASGRSVASQNVEKAAAAEVAVDWAVMLVLTKVCGFLVGGGENMGGSRRELDQALCCFSCADQEGGQGQKPPPFQRPRQSVHTNAPRTCMDLTQSPQILQKSTGAGGASRAFVAVTRRVTVPSAVQPVRRAVGGCELVLDDWLVD